MRLRSLMLCEIIALWSSLLSAAPAAPPTAPMTRPTDSADQMDDAAALAKAAELLDKLQHGRLRPAAYADVFRQLVNLGEPVQMPVLAYLSEKSFAENQLVEILRTEWARMGLRVSSRHRKEAVALLSRLNPSDWERTCRILDLLDPGPDLVNAYGPFFVRPEERIRNAAMERAMACDPSGEFVLAAVKARMVKWRGQYEYTFDGPLSRIGPAAIPFLIEISYRPDVDARIKALRSLRPWDGKSFNSDAAERAVELYPDPLGGLNAPTYQRGGFTRRIQLEALAVLDGMGPQGTSLANGLRAGRRPENAVRRSLAAQLDVPEEIKAALLPADPAAAIPATHRAVIERLAAAYKANPDDAAKQAVALVDESQDDGIRLIGGRFLSALPALNLQEVEVQRLMRAAMTADRRQLRAASVPDPRLQDALLSALLGGKLPYSPEIRDWCIQWTTAQDYAERTHAIAVLSAKPLGRRALIDALMQGRTHQYGIDDMLLAALVQRHPALSGMNRTSSNGKTIGLGACVQLIEAADAQPDRVVQLLIRSLDHRNPDIAIAAASTLTTEQYQSKLGPVTWARAQAMSARPVYVYGHMPVVAPAQIVPPVYRGPSPFHPQRKSILPATFFEGLWWATGLCAVLAILLLSLWALSLAPGAADRRQQAAFA